jgi:PAS domain S-box-containing protein
VDDIVYSVDLETEEFRYLSPAFERLLGYSSDDIKAMGGRIAFLEQVLGGEEDILRLHSAEAVAELDRAESWWRCKDGSLKYMEDHRTLVTENGQRVRTDGVLRDTTLHQEARTRMEHYAEELARSNADLEQFAYVASHDRQEPLRMVTGFVELLEQRYAGQLDSDAREFIGFAADGARRMQALIRDLLAFSRVGTRGKEPVAVDANVALRQAMANLEASIRESEATVHSEDLPAVLGEELQLTQLFQNLIGNGIKFHGDNDPVVNVSVRQEGEKAIISVSDNGIGIDPQYADRIFQIFQRLHEREQYEGTGIGLSICKRIVERLGGRIWLESTLGSGSTFHFSLTLA